MHYFIGDLGHLLVITSFITSLASAFSYYQAHRTADLTSKSSWLKNARTAFYIHAIGILGIVCTLYFIIERHYFEYHYAYAHSSLHLPGEYMISCFWEGQEGSFLLWMFWQALIGLILIHTQKMWESPVMVVFALVQAFLTSMILGISLPLSHTKIGSSPFILLREAMADPIFRVQPDFIPKDGNGLNALLQNYWMIIHPPTLFLGFALTLVPFAFCMAGLWQRKYSEWIRPALPWALIGGAILGAGILMGGYWAYETLSFGGYWNWDPVENAIYVPWLVLIGAIHMMMSNKSSGTNLRSSMILVIAVFVLILYSTFLTRSGILGEASVHAFTDLGMNGQLLIYMLFFTLIAIVLLGDRWSHIPSKPLEFSIYSRELWVFVGAIVLCLMGFQVLIPTSYPVFNRIAEIFGKTSSLAPPQSDVYSSRQLWFGVAVALISGLGQFFWWKRLTRQTIWNAFAVPLLITLLLWGGLLAVARLKPVYLPLSFAGIFIIVSNLKVLRSILKVNPRISGGAVAHIGVGLMLVGILFSAGYSKIVSLNNTGLIYIKEAGTEFNRDNLLLFLNEPRTMADYSIEYRGECVRPRHSPGFVKKKDITSTNDPFRVVANKEILFKGKVLFHAKDTFDIAPEDTYYEIELRRNDRLAATLYPRVQINPAMGGFIASPDISRNLKSDLYTHVSAPMDASATVEWGKPEEIKVTPGQKFFINDYVAVLEDVSRVDAIEGMKLDPDDAAIRAKIKVEGEHESYLAEPIILVRGLNGGHPDGNLIPSEIPDLGIRVTLASVHPATNEFSLTLNTRQKDWVIIKALEKPYINVLWLGTAILMVGFALASRRRFIEFRTGR